MSGTAATNHNNSTFPEGRHDSFPSYPVGHSPCAAAFRGNGSEKLLAYSIGHGNGVVKKNLKFQNPKHAKTGR